MFTLFMRYDMSSSAHVDNKKKENLILGESYTRIRWYNINCRKKSIQKTNFTEKNEKFCLKLHYNGASNYLFVNGIEIIKSKAKDSEIYPIPLCLGNISKDLSVDNLKKDRIKWICLWF